MRQIQIASMVAERLCLETFLSSDSSSDDDEEIAFLIINDTHVEPSAVSVHRSKPLDAALACTA